jgi:hypothetical protein
MAALLEACGRWLFRTPHTHQRMAQLLEAMMRVKRVSWWWWRSIAKFTLK